MLGGQCRCGMFTSFIFVKETHFRMTFWSGQLICVVYKFSSSSGLTLHLGLIWLLLSLDCLISDLIVHILSLFILSVFHWYSLRWFCVFLYIVPISVLIL